ncbi:MAG: class I SAM-dependent methyltransferase [Oligoflexales bacterium]|nr:class I SAM-dependent methyltransferase [Oligoflexales bacterium]
MTSRIDSIDWNESYIQKDAPWDSGEVSPEFRSRFVEWKIDSFSHPRVLDIGCGSGTNAIHLAKHQFHVTACDLSPEAISLAKRKAQDSSVCVEWMCADFLTHDWRCPPFPLLIDRGCYHILRHVNLNRFLTVLDQLTHKGSLFFVLTGNSHQTGEEGPPKVSAEELCQELGQVLHLKDLREFRFSKVRIGDRETNPLGWSSVWEKH